FAPGASSDPGSALIRIDISPGRKDLPIALPMPVGQDATARRIWEVVRRDLEMTGYFSIIDPKAYIDQSGGVGPGSFRYDDWRTIRALALAKSRVAVQEDGRLAADVFVYDVGAGDKISGKRFVGTPDDARYLGHRIADEILRSLTGLEGFFGTRIAAVGNRTGNKEIDVMDI